MATATLRCTECDHRSLQWLGRCPGCGAWDSFKEFKAVVRHAAAPTVKSLREVGAVRLERTPTGIAELDGVLGGGLVAGSVVLVAGEPGIGKSTLMLQAAASLARREVRVLYVCGEESAGQVAARAERLGGSGGVLCAETTQCEEVLELLGDCDVVIVDSIQTLRHSEIQSEPGSVSQVKASAAAIVRSARQTQTPVVLIGHVTKEGSVAGPKVLEHVVDAVLVFEGDRGHSIRIVRGTKNRFGSTGEVGVFEMTETGLKEIPDPASVILRERADGVSGSVVGCALEGRRALALEIQGLVGNERGTGRRVGVGLDQTRLGMIIGVIESRLGHRLSERDIYASVVGGLTANDPGLDLPIAFAILSASKRAPLPMDLGAVGELGLGGEVRAVPGMDKRIKELHRLGIAQVAAPVENRTSGVIPFRRLKDCAQFF